MIDLHSHLIPGVDDGAATLEESRAATVTLRGQGVSRLVTTPHLDGSITRRPELLASYFDRVDEAWGQLQGLMLEEFEGFQIARGAEVMLDTPEPDLSDPRVRMAGTDFVLVEFPYLNIPPHSPDAIYQLRVAGWKPVIAHPERYAAVEESLPLVQEWKRVGGLLQVNCGSLLGRYGETPKKVAFQLLRAGLVDYLSSDYHGRGRCAVGECRALLESSGGGEQARLLMEENPANLLEGRSPLPVTPFRGGDGLWQRLARVWR